jgi:putative hydrolase of the HAD superfamily
MGANTRFSVAALLKAHSRETTVRRTLGMTPNLSQSGIRAFIVDYGGVISLKPTAVQLDRLQTLCGCESSRFRSAWLDHRHDYDVGKLSASEYWARVTDRRHTPHQLDEIVAADADSWAETNAAMIEWLRDLKAAGFLVAVLSNMPREVWIAFEHRHVWLDLCNVITLSWQQQAAKPEATLYRHCLDGLAIRADEALFIDDTAENVEAAAALGLQTVLYEDVDRLREQLGDRFADELPLPQRR